MGIASFWGRDSFSVGEAPMDALVKRLDTKLREWDPNIAAEVREQISEIIDLADQDALDIMRSRAVEQEVLDLLDEPIFQ